MRYLTPVAAALEKLVFQCPEGRYSSALLLWDEVNASPTQCFSAPKGVIAVRYEASYTLCFDFMECFSAPKGVIAVRYLHRRLEDQAGR